MTWPYVMTKYRTFLAALFSLILVMLGTFLSWTATLATYQVWTSNGSIFASNDNQDVDLTKLKNVNISSWDNLYTREYSEKTKTVRYRIFVANQFVCEISAGLDPIEFEGGEKLSISWKYGGGATRDNMKTLFGIGVSGSSADVFVMNEGPWFTPFTRQVSIGIPSGSFAPVVKKAIQQGIVAANLSIEDKYLNAFSTRVSQGIRTDIRIEQAYEKIDGFISKFGPVQYATLWLFYFFCFLIVVSFWFEWAKLAAEMASGMIPFVGFFGTLLGMAGALGILGSTDLSDPVSKSINLGPIGSELGFAIRTTIFAFVFYALSFLIYIVRMAVYENETYVALNKSGSWASNLVLKVYKFLARRRRAKVPN